MLKTVSHPLPPHQAVLFHAVTQQGRAVLCGCWLCQMLFVHCDGENIGLDPVPPYFIFN